MSHEWMHEVTENPQVGDTEVWEFYNFTADAHPMHVHEVVFQVVDRQPITFTEGMMGPEHVALAGAARPPELGETGFKDTVTAYPGEVTRIRAQFNESGPVRLALPHRRARGQRDDAAVPHRTAAAGPAPGDADAHAVRPSQRTSRERRRRPQGRRRLFVYGA